MTKLKNLLAEKRILVTGGAGFIGSHIVERLLKEGAEVFILDDFSTGKKENITDFLKSKRCHLLKGDIRDQVVAKRAMKDIDAVFHEAALINISQSVKDPLLANDINISGTLNLIKHASDAGVKRFIFASSAAVYGESLPRKVETMQTDPISIYGVSKLAVEKYLNAFYSTHGLETVSLRYFNVYGPRQNFDNNAQYGGVITIFLNRLLNNLSPVIYGDGEQTRDFVYVQDIVEANLCALTTRRGVGDFFNVGTGNKISINQMAEYLKLTLNKRHIPNIYTAQRIGDVKHGYADVGKAASILDFKAQYTFDEGIRSLVNWYIQK